MHASTPAAAAYPYGPFGASQRDRVTNGPEALGELVTQFADTAGAGSRTPT